MKLTYFQLEQNLSKSLAPAYIVTGEEFILIQDSIRLIKRHARQKGYTGQVRITLESGFGPDQLYPLLYSSSLMGDKNLLLLDCKQHLPNKETGELIAEYLKNPSSDNILIFTCNKADDKLLKSTWFKAIDKIGVHLAIWPVPYEQLSKWIMQRGKKFNLTIQPDAASLLADYTEGNLVAAAHAIEKLILLQHKEAISVTEVETIITDESRFTIFDLVDALLNGNATRAFDILNNLQQEGIEAILVLWAITRELRILANLAHEHSSGNTLESLFQKNRIFTKRQPSVRRFITRHQPDCYGKLITEAANIDQMIKGALPGNPWEAIQFLCLKMV